MAEETVGELYVTRTINGVEVKFRKLTPYDRAAILKQLKAQKRAALLQDLCDVQATKEEKLSELRAFDEDTQLGEIDFINHINTPEGKVAVLETALREVPEAQRQAIRDGLLLTGIEALKLVAELCNLEVGSGPEGEGDDPNAGRPAPEAEPDSYSQPDTATMTATPTT